MLAGVGPAVGVAIGLGLASLASAAHAQTIIVPSDHSSITSSTGVNLPQPVPVYGQDEVQAAGGVACRSSVASGGPYIDMGVVGSQDMFSRQVSTAYARVVFPIGKAPRRVDCSQLYALEIERLRMELELARMNMPPSGSASSAAR